MLWITELLYLDSLLCILIVILSLFEKVNIDRLYLEHTAGKDKRQKINAQ